MNEIIQKFKLELEDYLDVYFPKAENTDVRKSPNNRSAALVLYAEAVILFEKYLKEHEIMTEDKEIKKGENWRRGYLQGQKEERQFILNILDGIDLADKEMDNQGGGTEAIRLALRNRII